LARIVLVDDSASACAFLKRELEAQQHVVLDFRTAEEAATHAVSSPPDVVVTDLWMPSISGLQLCRLLQADTATAHVPVVLLTASDDRRSRFWARHAGAAAYITKQEVGRLLDYVASVKPTSQVPPNSTRTSLRTVPQRLSDLMDNLLQTSTLAGELRRLGLFADSHEVLFRALAKLMSSVMTYRWLALVLEDDALFVHANPEFDLQAVAEARTCFDVRAKTPARRRIEEEGVLLVSDDLAIGSTSALAAPSTFRIVYGDVTLGQFALSPEKRGLSRDERSLLALVEQELGGPLRMAALVLEARRLASTDSLTGLYNRRAFAELFEQARIKIGIPTSLLILDIDHFKKVNDTRGHDVGDVVLRRVSEILRSMGRKRDIVGRWGGEEFVVGLPGSPTSGARIVAERLRRAIAEKPIETTHGEPIPVTASIGVATMTHAAERLDELVQRADKALYSAKERGRNRVELA
jgi:two-component system, cell cycle response regulator